MPLGCCLDSSRMARHASTHRSRTVPGWLAKDAGPASGSVCLKLPRALVQVQQRLIAIIPEASGASDVFLTANSCVSRFEALFWAGRVLASWHCEWPMPRQAH